MTDFGGRVVIRLVVDNYNFGEVVEALTVKLGELPFVVASLVEVDGE